MFTGSIVAIVTPFKSGAVDEEKLRELVEFQIANGTDGIVPCGTTGESPTLDHDEHKRVIDIVIQAANIVPREVSDPTHAFLGGDWKRARELHLKLFPLCQAMFYETNPIPVKTALAMMEGSGGVQAPALRDDRRQSKAAGGGVEGVWNPEELMTNDE